MAGGPLRLATRGSPLARAQAERVATLLNVECELVIVSTAGDRRADEPIWRMGGKGVFVKEVQQAVLDGGADIAVHSAKDLPASTPDGLVLAAFPERVDPRDALVGTHLDDLPTGARVATGSVRRRAQLAHLRPDLTFAELRGNIETRVAKALDHAAVVVANAALIRAGLTPAVVDPLEPAVMLPQVGQGALALECRSDDDATLAALSAIDRPDVRIAVTAERGYLSALGGDCNLPAGAFAQPLDGGGVAIEVLLASLDGHVVLRHRARGSDPDTVGRDAARALLDEQGGRMLVEAAP
ncbi:MAG TPA: hydroxymethylbilane synthase [Acidimicrobiia bacterium]|nr:hydroxymethylbilane synthase [Acidimicrobiia bacterium]